MICSLYSNVVEISKATFNTGTGNNPGIVIRSYAYQRISGQVSMAPTSVTKSSTSFVSPTSALSSTTSDLVSSTSSSSPEASISIGYPGLPNQNATSSSTSAMASSTPTGPPKYPLSPSGASLVQFAPCDGTKATLPMFVNKGWANDSVSFASKAYIITVSRLRISEELKLHRN